MPSHRQIEKATDLEEALLLSSQEGAALVEDDDDDGEEYLPESPAYGDDDEEDPDIADLNDPDVQSFDDPPQLGTRSQRSDMFGSGADTFGRASSPKLYAQAANFPTAVQYRVWRWENGIPVALGAIDAEATEEDMVRKFYEAMPKRGDNRFQFRFRPVDIRGKELGKEFTLNFSEHHAEVVRIRRQKEDDREERGVNDPILINQGSDSGAQYAEEMGRMFEQAVEASERRTELLQQTLEDERNRLREEEKSRYQERIQVADRSATVVQQMTDKLMQTDRARSEEQVKSQREQGQMLLSTLTTVFSQQQESSRVQAERLRESDASRMQQDRAYFERQRLDSEERRKIDGLEWERKRTQEREDSDRRVQSERDRLALEGTRIQEQRKFELEQMRIDADKREKEAEVRREREKEEARLRLERERMELDHRRQAQVAERERWREELETKRRTEREEWDRKRVQEREDAERRERADRERIERERQDFQLRMERERQEAETREGRRGQEMQREADRRREEMALQQKQMEMTAQRDREHAERLAESARVERESREQVQLRREKMERDSREMADKERQRRHEMQMREMELAEQRKQQHEERMLQLRRSENSGGISGLVETLGMEAPELLGRIFGGGEGGDEGGWASAVPKVLGSIAELGKAAMTAKQEVGKEAVHGRRRVQGPQGPGQIVQTPQGPVMLVPQGAQGIPVPTQQMHPDFADLPMDPSIPEGFEDFDEEESPVLDAEATEGEVQPEPEVEEVPSEVDTLARAKAAGMSLRDQKKARKAVRALAEALSGVEESEWTGLITEAITSEVSIYYYIKAVTVTAALHEAGADPELASSVVVAMKESGLIPEDVPYDELDYARLTADAEGGEE